MKYYRERIEISRRIWSYVSEYRVQWLTLFLLKLGQIIPRLIQPLVFKLFIDELIKGKNTDFIVRIIGLYLGLYLLESILKLAHSYVDNSLFKKTSLKLRRLMWYKYSYMAIYKFRDYEVSDLKTRIDTDVEILRQFIIWELFDYLAYIISFLAAGVIMWTLDWKLALVSYIVLPFSLVISTSYQKSLKDLYEDERLIKKDTEEFMQVSLSNWREIKANNFLAWHGEKFDYYLDDQYLNYQKTRTVLMKRNMFLNIKEYLINRLLVLGAGGIFYLNKMLGLGTIVASGEYYSRMNKNLSDLTKMDVELEKLIPSVNRVIEILEMEGGERLGPEEKQAFTIKEDGLVFQLEGLTHTYGNSRQDTLKDLSMEVEKGEKLLIFGKSGSGKSTLRKIMTGEIIPKEGKVKFYGEDISKLNHQVLYSKMDIVYKESYFINCSIREYLTMANEDISQEEIEAACRKTNILDFIRGLPKAFESKIGESGQRLSEGQKQRLALTRLFISSKEIIVLDEAFSAIDGKDKSRILENMLEDFQDKTFICISHDEGIRSYFPSKVYL